MIDSHAHLSTPSLREDLEGILTRAQEAGVTRIVNICTTPDELVHGLELSRTHAWISTVAATTPHDVEKEGEAHFGAMARHARAGDLVAVGETGLDYYYTHSAREIQQAFLRRYLRLAQECQLPVVIHCRDAFEDFFRILDEEYTGAGVLHCFTGTVEEAREVVARGWYLSLSGIVTFKKSEVLREVAKITPLSQLLIETDTPYLAPMPYRGKRNEPAYVVETAKCIAACRGASVEEVGAATAENAQALLKLS